MPLGRNVLEVTNIRESANYTCVAISSLGMIEATAQVTVKGETCCSDCRFLNLSVRLLLIQKMTLKENKTL